MLIIAISSLFFSISASVSSKSFLPPAALGIKLPPSLNHLVYLTISSSSGVKPNYVRSAPGITPISANLVAVVS